jgi:hypothetical protein
LGLVHYGEKSMEYGLLLPCGRIYLVEGASACGGANLEEKRCIKLRLGTPCGWFHLVEERIS